jgi:hypothetical protein
VTAKPAVEKDRQPLKPAEYFPKSASGPGIYRARCVFVFIVWKDLGTQFGTYFCAPLYQSVAEDLNMLVERGLQVMNVEAVGEAYAIASNYLRRTGAIADTIATNERLLGIIVQMFQRGEFNKIRLANKAISRFEAETLIA